MRKPTAVWLSLIALCVSGVVCAAAAHPQFGVTKKIKRVKIPSEPVQIQAIRVKDKLVKPGEELYVSDDWVDAVTISVKNVSGKTVTKLMVSFNLPVYDVDEHAVDMAFFYEAPVRPGETVHVSTSPRRNAALLEYLAERGKAVDFREAELKVNQVHFDDNTVWMQGTVYRRNPENPREVEKLSEPPAPGSARAGRGGASFLTASLTRRDETLNCRAVNHVFPPCNGTNFCSYTDNQIDPKRSGSYKGRYMTVSCGGDFTCGIASFNRAEFTCYMDTE